MRKLLILHRNIIQFVKGDFNMSLVHFKILAGIPYTHRVLYWCLIDLFHFIFILLNENISVWMIVISLYNVVDGVSAYNTWINRLVFKVDVWNIYFFNNIGKMIIGYFCRFLIIINNFSAFH